MQDDVTPVLLTYNEAPNIERTLARLAWASRIVIVDSESTDQTRSLARGFPQVELVVREFDNFVNQWNYALQLVRTEWALSLDADYVLSDALKDEIFKLENTATIDGYRASFTYCVAGKPLRASLYPPRVILFRVQRARYVSDGHTQRVTIDGVIDDLRGRIYHDDRKPLPRWLSNQREYAVIEAKKLLESKRGQLNRVDRLRRLGWPVPFLTPVYCLFFKGLVLDGRAGLLYTFQRTYAEVLLALIINHTRLTRSNS